MRWPHYVMIAVMAMAFAQNVRVVVRDRTVSSDRATAYCFGYAVYWILFAMLLGAGGFWP